MTSTPTPETLLKAGQLPETLKALENQIRANPADAKLRVFLFQLLCVLGNFERALNQLNVAADLDPANLLMAQACRPAIACEMLRRDVFAGRKLPLVLGQPQEWIAWLLQANQLTAQGHHAQAQELRNKAFDAAPPTPGTLNGQPFEWIADADQRLGPVLELIMDGKYYWCPFSHIRELKTEPPADLRDMVWTAANLSWHNGGQAVALIPTRYPDSENASDAGLRLARTTQWVDLPEGLATCLGQRLLVTDAAETPLLEIRTLQLTPPVTAEAFASPAPSAEAAQ